MLLLLSSDYLLLACGEKGGDEGAVIVKKVDIRYCCTRSLQDTDFIVSPMWGCLTFFLERRSSGRPFDV